MKRNELKKYKVNFSITYYTGMEKNVTIIQVEKDGIKAAQKAENFIRENWSNIKKIQLKNWNMSQPID